jgi:signal transduction histidine kinase
VTDRSRVAIGRGMAVVAIVSAVVGNVWLIALGETELVWNDWVIHNGVVALGSGLIVWLVLESQPRNGSIWVFAWTGLCTGLLCLGSAVAVQSLSNLGFSTALLEAVPATLPVPLALLAMNVNWLWVPVLLPFTLGLVLFPDGHPPSRRWRWLPWLVIGLVAMTCIGLFWEARPSGVYSLGETQDGNGGFRTIAASMVSIGYPAMFATVPFCVAALVVRFRRSAGSERQQFRWVVWGAGVAGLLMVSALVLDEVFGRVDIALGAGFIGMTILLLSFGIAIGKYRLYDIDVVISRTLVYGSLAFLITVLYVAIVVGIGYLFGAHDEPSPVVGLVATVLIAILFQPMRRRLQRIANRVVFGRRATPYEVLSTFSQRVSAVDPEVIGQIARSLAEGTTATSVAIWMNRGEDLHRIAVWPADGAPNAFARPGEVPDADRIAVVAHEKAPIGLITLKLGQDQSFTSTDQRLLDQVAGGLGLALRNLTLTENLRQRVDQLRESRQRIVAVQDQTRRNLERDLHDGAQQRLVALKIKLGIGMSMATKAAADDVSEMLGTVQEEANDIIETVREFARGIYPPLLEASGLAAAVTGQARKISLPVTVQAVGIERYPRDIEATVYFCVLEAIQNVVQHANASSVVVTIRDDDGVLTFEVRDDGIGFEPDMTALGGGLRNLTDRIDAIGGTTTIVSAPTKGTVVVGTIHVPQHVGALA